MRTKILAVALLLLGVSLLPLRSAAADTGPKPSMTFEFTQSFAGEKLAITSGRMFECEQADCSDAEELRMLGPQGFRCSDKTCNATGYGFSTYHRIEVQFSDGKTRSSNIFQTAAFDSSYRVTVNPDDLQVESTTPPTSMLPGLAVLGCCLALLALVIIIVTVVLLVRRRRSAGA